MIEFTPEVRKIWEEVKHLSDEQRIQKLKQREKELQSDVKSCQGQLGHLKFLLSMASDHLTGWDAHFNSLVKALSSALDGVGFDGGGYTKDTTEILQMAKLFRLDGCDLPDLSSYMNECIESDRLSSFYLPFPVTAVCRDDACRMFCDDLSRESCVGTDLWRRYVEAWKSEDGICLLTCSFCCDEDGNFSTDDVAMCRVNKKGRAEWAVLKHFAWIDDKTPELAGPEGIESSLENSIRKRLRDGVAQVLWFTDPKWFILEESTDRINRLVSRDKGKRVARAHERPTYTLLKPKKIRERMGLPEPGKAGGVRLPHERRAHWKMLRHERYVNMRGKRIFVKASWIGPSESRVGRKIYKVML